MKLLKILLLFSILFLSNCSDKSNDSAISDNPIWECTEEETELDIFTSNVSNSLKYLVIHCTATPYPTNTWGPEELKKYFREERGWSRPGYLYYITYDGIIHPLWYGNIDSKVESIEIVNGAKGYNHESLHIAYQGGVDRFGKAKDTRTREQRTSLRSLVNIVRNANPSVKVIGHNELTNKACPSFDVSQEY